MHFRKDFAKYKNYFLERWKKLITKWDLSQNLSKYRLLKRGLDCALIAAYKHLHSEKVLTALLVDKDFVRTNGWRRKLNTFKCESRISWRQVYSMGLQTCRRQGLTWRYPIHLWPDVRDWLCMEAAQDPVTYLSWGSVQVFLQKMVLPVSNSAQVCSVALLKLSGGFVYASSTQDVWSRS